MATSKRSQNLDNSRLRCFPADYDLRDEVWFPRAESATKNFLYGESDQVETALGKIIAGAKDKSLFSPEFREGLCDATLRYHLAAARGNLLRPFKHLFQSRVLEIGAGCGALTRFLGECGGPIIAVEESPERAKIARARTSDLANVSVVCETIDQLHCDEQFDVVVAIGALGHARLLDPGKNTSEYTFLESVSRMLSDDGILVLAIDNRLGLKYFDDFNEGHTGVPYAGINNNYTNNSNVTFCLDELQDILRIIGLSNQNCFVPLPDYRLPVSIISPAGIDEPLFNVESLFAESVSSDRQLPENFPFSLEQAWSPIVRDRLAQSFANSFLIVAGRRAESVTAATAVDCLAWHYAVDRHPHFMTETRFLKSRDELVVEKNCLCEADKPNVPLDHIFDERPYIYGANYWLDFVSVVNVRGWSVKDIAAWSRKWIHLVVQKSGMRVFDTRSFFKLVPGDLFDATPFNCIRDRNGVVRLIDQEWRVKHSLELGFILFRGLRDSILRVTSYAKPASGTPISVNHLVIAVFAELGLSVTDTDIDRFASLEQRIQGWVASGSDDSVDPQTIDFLWGQPLNVRGGTTSAADVATPTWPPQAVTTNEAVIQHFGQATQAMSHALDLMAEARADLACRLDEVGRRAANLDDARLQLAKELSGAEANSRHAETQVDILTKTIRTLRQENSALNAHNEQLHLTHQLENSASDKLVGRFGSLIPGPVRRYLKRAILRLGTTPPSQLADIVRASGLFDPDDYKSRSGPSCQHLDPAFHYVTVGERLGIRPSARFNPAYYGERYPDVASAGMCHLAHYVQHGRSEGRRALPLAMDPGFDGERFAPEKGTILLVSHEASRTGAPVLALTIGQSLSAQYNLLTILLRGGGLVDSFREISSRVICFAAGDELPVEFKHGLSSLLREHPIRYAILNSIECKEVVPYLGQAFIPTVSLINEFSSYTRPFGAVREALGWMTELVFSTQVTADSFRKDHPALLQRRLHVLPQGRCSLPAPASNAEAKAERQNLEAAMRPPGAEDALVVLGAGSVHIRKGVDLFITSAKAALRLGGKRCRVRFVWIGHGYDPERDMSYSAYIKEQIARSGLEGQFVLLDEVTNLDPAYEMADVFYLASRLDPLPNVTIEAALRGLPIICFEEASGMAEILKRNPIASKTVISHLDAYAAARRIVELAKDENLRQRIGKATRTLARTAFDIDRYVRHIDEIGSLAVDSMRQRHADFETLVNDSSFDPGIFLPAIAPPTTREVAISRFLACWSAARTAPHQVDYLALRRPCAGFNPQIYAHHHPELIQSDINPLADFIRKRRPKGPWLHSVIQPDLVKLKARRKSKLRTAIQAHFHYPELIGDFLNKIAANQACCDLLLSTNEDPKAELLRAAAASFDRGRVDIRVVPNRGRDIGPLLTSYASELAQDYDVVGHFHSKRSSGVNRVMGDTWREFLWQQLLGPRYPMMDLALARFAEDEKLGLIFAEEPHLCDWDDNLAMAEELADQAELGTPLPPFFEFPVGTMFWARPKALAPLLDLELAWGDYPEEPLANDGTILHALERLLPFAAQKQGYQYATVHIPGITR